MLILIFINVQYLQDVAFSFEKSLNGQNHSLSDFHYCIKKSASVKFTMLPHWGFSPTPWQYLENPIKNYKF